MGTRGAYGFYLKGQEKVTYNHYDSYPSGLGERILNFIHTHSNQQMLEMAERIIMVDENSKPTTEQIVQCSPFLDLSVSTKDAEDWYCLLRNAQGDLTAQEKMPYMIEYRTFLFDSLFCEYAYIINLDTLQLEYYTGFNKDPEAPGRYAKTDGDRSGYCGMRLAREFDLDNDIRDVNVADVIKIMDSYKEVDD